VKHTQQSRTPGSLSAALPLLVIFGVLCLTVFAVLSVSTALSDKRLSDAALQAVQQTYEADAQAETILAALRRGEVPAGVTRSGEDYSFAVPVSDTTVLAVSVTIHENDHTIHRWQQLYTADWSPDQTLAVWSGD